MEKDNKFPKINIVVIGHVDSGKSTTTGHLIYLCGGVSEKELVNLRKKAELAGKGSYAFAWVVDKLKAERDRGVTISANHTEFISKKYQYSLIDTPGHRDFIKNMITGTSRSDCAILVVSSQKGEFEAGFGENGQTREHALLANTLGVKNIIVAVNKMDHSSTNYSKERYDEIRKKVLSYLKSSADYKIEIPCIPISGWTGENLTELSPRLNWYKGETLLGALDNLKPPKKPTDLPLRIPIQDVFKIEGIGIIPVGRVETGIIRPGMELTFGPTGLTDECVALEMHHETVKEAIPGDKIGFHVKNTSVSAIKRGHVASETQNNPARSTKEFTAQILLLSHPNEIRVGYTPIIDCHTAHIACRFAELLEKIDIPTGQVIENNPEYLKKGDIGLVRMIPSKPMCVESFKEFAPLGRITIRDMRQTVGVGVIKSMKPYEKSK